jgi:hypothetical protein
MFLRLKNKVVKVGYKTVVKLTGSILDKSVKGVGVNLAD